MKNTKLIFLSLLISLIAFNANCKNKPGGNLANGAILNSLIGGLGKGNCGISLNLSTLYSGAILQAAVNSTTTFTQADYEAASNTTVGTGQTYTTYASVPYNVKYDAFIKGSATYDSTARTADINTGKASVDLTALSLLNASATTNFTVLNATTYAVANAFWTSFSSDEQTKIGAAASTASSGSVTLTTLNTAYGSSAAYAASIGGGLGTFFGNVVTAAGGATAAGAAYQARQALNNGTAILACSRIPKASCSFEGLTTATQKIAITKAVTQYDLIASNPDCRKTTADSMNAVTRIQFTGVPRGTVISGFANRPSITTSPTDLYIPVSEGSTFSSNTIFPEKAYPIASALSSINASFNVAFPMTAAGTTPVAQASSTIPYYQASNIATTVVDSCESLGLPGTGPIASQTNVTNAATLAGRKELTTAKEISYAFSDANAAAIVYAASIGAAQGTTNTVGLDAIACNNSFRSSFAVSSVIGGGTLPKLESAISGDGAATSLLTACLYGGTATGRTTSASLLASTTLSGISDCPSTASAGAAKFGDTGLTKLSSFPND